MNGPAAVGSEPDGAFVARCHFARHRLWAEKRPPLRHLDIELTERCNNACIHCYINRPASDPRAGARELTTGEWQEIMRQAAELGALSVRFTGGEPLLRADFADLYLHARRLGLKVVLFTNARLVTPQLATLLARTPPLEKIQVTAYGMRPASYAAVARAPGAYAEFRRGLALLAEHKVPFVVKGVVLPPLHAEMDEFEAWVATLPGVDERPIYSLYLELRGRRDSPAKNQRIARMRLSPEQMLAMVTREPERFRRGMAEFCARFARPPGDLLFGCGAGREGCVDAYGRYQPCMLLRAPELAYDLRSGSLRDALVNFFPGVRELRSANPTYLARCARCFLKGLCEQCPAKSWSEHGTLDTPVEYLCEVAHVQARYLGLLRAGERAWEVTDGRERVQAMAKEIIG